MRRVLTVAAAVLTLTVAACQPAEPKMTITATAPMFPQAFTTSHVSGKVTPANATGKVVLQRTVNGKWVDWKACPGSCGPDDIPKVPRANVNQTTGAYSIAYPVQWCGIVLHLRVRSEGGTAFSPGLYREADPHESC